MKHIRSFLCLLLLSGLGTTMHAQSTISATGGNASGTGGNLSYTIGQVAYMTISGITGTVTQGVQQPYEISVVTAIKNTEEINLECLVYPNPTRGLTKLVFKSSDYENMRIQLFDLNGVPLLDK